MYYYGARWYDPAVGRFVQADTIIPRGVQGLDRYAYTANNPVRYVDPSGHSYCDSKYAAEDVECYDTTRILSEFYGISLVAGNGGKFTEEEISAIYAAVQAVGAKFSQAIGGGLTSGEAFKQVYDNITFLKGTKNADGTTYSGLSDECKGIASGGCTSGAHLINFASMAGAGFLGARSTLRNRNNVVHELGHAFASTSTGKKAYVDLGKTISNDPSTYGRGILPESYGFASAFGTFDWQMSYTDPETPNEIFADQFLGWTFNTWYDGTWGEFDRDLAINQADARSTWMKTYMASYLR